MVTNRRLSKPFFCAINHSMLSHEQSRKLNLLPLEAINEFKDLFRKRFDIGLSDEEASFRAGNLVGLYRAVYSRSVQQKTPMGKPTK